MERFWHFVRVTFLACIYVAGMGFITFILPLIIISLLDLPWWPSHIFYLMWMIVVGLVAINSALS